MLLTIDGDEMYIHGRKKKGWLNIWQLYTEQNRNDASPIAKRLFHKPNVDAKDVTLYKKDSLNATHQSLGTCACDDNIIGHAIHMLCLHGTHNATDAITVLQVWLPWDHWCHFNLAYRMYNPQITQKPLMNIPKVT